MSRRCRPRITAKRASAGGRPSVWGWTRMEAAMLAAPVEPLAPLRRSESLRFSFFTRPVMKTVNAQTSIATLAARMMGKKSSMRCAPLDLNLLPQEQFGGERDAAAFDAL